MLKYFVKKWLIAQRQRDYEREALQHEFQAAEIYLDIRNCKGLIELEKEDIKANDGDIKQDEFEIEKAKKANDEELFEWYKDELLESGKDPSELPTELTVELIAQLQKDNNEYVVELQQEIKNLKASNDRARESITAREMELKGIKDPSGKILKQGHNTRYQGHIAAAQKSRIHAQELTKFLRKQHKNKIKLVEEAPVQDE